MEIKGKARPSDKTVAPINKLLESVAPGLWICQRINSGEVEETHVGGCFDAQDCPARCGFDSRGVLSLWNGDAR